MAEPRDWQLRIYYRLDGERYNDDFWTTKSIADALTGPSDSIEYRRALKKLNPQLRHRQGYDAKDWRFEIKPQDILDQPELVGIKETASPGQQALFGHKIEKKTKYFKPPLQLEPKKQQESKQLELFWDF